MLKGMTKHEDEEHGKTLKHEAPYRINHKATQTKNKTGTTALERSNLKLQRRDRLVKYTIQ